MPKRCSITADELRRLLHYDPETGIFTRLVDAGGRHGRAGTVAGAVDHDRRRVQISLHSHLYPAPHLAWLYMTGEWPKIDAAPADGDGLNVRWSNLVDRAKPVIRHRRSAEREAMMSAPRRSAEDEISIEMLRERVSYNPETGELRWRDRVPASSFIDERGCTIWHGKFAGKPIMKRQHGYIVVSISHGLKTFYLQGHRVAWALMTGAWPEHEVDHENRIRSDNRWLNLRDATRLQNAWNTGLSVRNKSGFKGVHRNGKRWVSQIRINGRTRHLGVFDLPEVAAEAYRAAAVQHRGEFAANV